VQDNRRGEYVHRINRVIDYIEANLAGDLSLNQLAKVACFSPFHFHRIFRAMVGETCSQFVRRIRVERAALKLAHNPKQSVTEIALDTGFSSLETFSRTFRDAFGMTASEWREQGSEPDSKIRKANGKDDQAVGKIRREVAVSSPYVVPNTGNMMWRITMPKNTSETTTDVTNVEVEVKDLPELHVAYLRHIGPYKGDSALFASLFEKLYMWAGPRGLVRPPETKVISVYHDDPDLTDDDKLRTSICITVPDDTVVEGEIGKMTVPGGQFAVGHFELADTEYEAAWNAMYGGWLPDSGFQPDDRACYELFLNNPEEHPEKKCIVDICIPVRPL
jgi:AraC family transcriptional regulator